MEYENPQSFYIEIKKSKPSKFSNGYVGTGIISVQRSKMRETASVSCE